MTRYDHLAKYGEHIFSMTDRGVKYLHRYLKKGEVLARSKADKQDHDTIQEACRSLLYGRL